MHRAASCPWAVLRNGSRATAAGGVFSVVGGSGSGARTGGAMAMYSGCGRPMRLRW
ncbi:hypothetical protein PF003_g15999 [Phytophthora fragariae]|nr:hypothetical protein PF003_g15999 [Phytophthora fragariae]